MITNKDLEIVKLSPTKKDFYQIWNELLETAAKISNRWDPTSTNESDPGIVLLKVLTGIADKLNYNIDKNILEAFMPSVTQQESMRKLCDLVGYNIKYYQSAETEIRVGWTGKIESGMFKVDGIEDTSVSAINIPLFTTIKDVNDEICYTTTEAGTINATVQVAKIPCIEGQVVQCGADTDYVISLNNLDDNNRYYLPEAQIAENGFFIYTINNGSYLKNKWTKVDNLNTQATGSLVYKFGFDSKLGMPYIQFPDDISAIIEDGLYIWYTRTLGVNGNIKARTLTKLELLPEDNESLGTDAESFYQFLSATNEDAAMNGCNIETINQAYDNYKRTIGTFDTLITCRDYVNKIYELYDDMNIPLVSNIIASDIRDDLNRAVTLCTFNQFGISYVDKKLTTGTGANKKDKITNFDIILYPFKTIYGLNTKDEYKDSFTYTEEKFNTILYDIDKLKTISHDFKYAENGDIICIKNYFRIDAKITTTYKVNIIEEKEILNNIYTNIYKTFNARQLEFGEDIPFDLIEDCITNADPRIKNISMNDPELVTKICYKNNSGEFAECATTDSNWKDYYIKLIARNILAGKVPLFKYDESFKPEITESPYNNYENMVYGPVKRIEPKCQIEVMGNGTIAPPITLKANELIQFRAPNFKTTYTYPAYVNYFAQLESAGGEEAIAARMIPLKTFMEMENHWSDFTGNVTDAEKSALRDKKSVLNNVTADNFDGLKNAYGRIFVDGTSTDEIEIQSTYDGEKTYYAIMLNSNTFGEWYSYICSLDTTKYKGLFFKLNLDMSRPAGKLVDIDHWKYRQATSPEAVTETEALLKYCVQDITETTTYGIGQDSTAVGIPKNTERVLGENEYILINYTTSSNDADGEDVIKNEVLKPGDIVRTNFDLTDSLEWSKNHTYAKTNQSTFGPWDNYNKPAGMFSLGPNEQIEKREQVSITLEAESGTKNINFYWNLNTNDEQFPSSADGYILQEGEYFYYTDENKLEMIYFGNGTQIKLIGGITLKKDSTKTSVSADDILNNGIAAIPWVLASVGQGRKVEINEFQYITLGEGDTLTSLALSVPNTSTATAPYDLSEAWWRVGNGGAEYVINGDPQKLPDIGKVPNSVLTESGTYWEVHSRLLINSGQNLVQTLEDTRDSISIYDTSYTLLKEITPTDNDNPISIKTNYLCQVSTDSYDITADDFKVKVFKNNALEINQNANKQVLTINNFGKLWTKISWNTLEHIESTSDATVNISTAIPSAKFGMLMIYYIKKASSTISTNTNNGYITFTSAPGSTDSLTIYNYHGSGTADTWWESGTSGSNYYLRPGINCIKIPSTVKGIVIHKNTDNDTLEDTLILSSLDIVDTTNYSGVNYSLLGLSSADVNDLLEHIRANLDVDTNFYYNCQIENSNAIDLNAESETMATETIWYDYNNVNNKFVISEIDADYLATGITLTRSSKL